MIAELIDPAVLGFILVGVMLFAIFVGFPISFTLIFLGPSSTAKCFVIASTPALAVPACVYNKVPL